MHRISPWKTCTASGRNRLRTNPAYPSEDEQRGTAMPNLPLGLPLCAAKASSGALDFAAPSWQLGLGLHSRIHKLELRRIDSTSSNAAKENVRTGRRTSNLLQIGSPSSCTGNSCRNKMQTGLSEEIESANRAPRLYFAMGSLTSTIFAQLSKQRRLSKFQHAYFWLHGLRPRPLASKIFVAKHSLDRHQHHHPRLAHHRLSPHCYRKHQSPGSLVSTAMMKMTMKTGAARPASCSPSFFELDDLPRLYYCQRVMVFV